MSSGENKSFFVFRFYTYLVERFSLYAVLPSTLFHYLLIIYYTTGESYPIDLYTYVIGFLSFFTYFILLRLFDDIKDKSHDDNYYKERPIQRCLISLKEIRASIIVLSVLLFLINAPLVGTNAFWILALAYGYLILMRQEFFIPEYLKPKLILYLISHQLFVPILVSYLIYLNSGSITGWRDISFLLLNLLLVMSVEVARKIRSSSEENPSRDTYSSYMGKNQSIIFLFVIMSVTVYLFINIFAMSNLLYLNLIVLAVSSALYLKKDTPSSSKIILGGTAFINFLNIILVIT